MSEQLPDMTPPEDAGPPAEQPLIHHGLYQGKEVEIKDHIEKGGKEYAILSDGQRILSNEIEYTGSVSTTEPSGDKVADSTVEAEEVIPDSDSGAPADEGGFTKPPNDNDAEKQKNIPEPKEGDRFIYPDKETGDIKVEVAAVAADVVGNKIYDLKITMPNGEVQESHPTLSEFKQALTDRQGSWQYVPAATTTAEAPSTETESEAEEKKDDPDNFKPEERVKFHLGDSVVEATVIKVIEEERKGKKYKLVGVRVEEGPAKGEYKKVPYRFVAHFTEEGQEESEPPEDATIWKTPQDTEIVVEKKDETSSEDAKGQQEDKNSSEGHTEESEITADEDAEKNEVINDLEEQVELFLDKEVGIKSESGEWIEGYFAIRYVEYGGEELVVIGSNPKTEEHAVPAEDFIMWQHEKELEEIAKKRAEREKKEKEESMLTVRVELDESIGPEVTIEDLKDPGARRRRVWQKRRERASNSAVGLSAKQFKNDTGTLGRRWSGRVMKLKSSTIKYFFNSKPSEADKEKLFKEPLDNDELKRRQIALEKKLNEGQLTKQEAEKLQNRKLTDEQWDYISNNQAEKDKLLKDQIRRIEEKEELSDEQWSRIKNGELTDNINNYLQSLDESPLTSAEKASREERKRAEIKKKLRRRQATALAVGSWATGATVVALPL